MNFFNFKRRHWMALIIFTAVVVAIVAGYAYFVDRQIGKFRMVMQREIVPEGFKLSEAEEKAQKLEADSAKSLSRAAHPSCDKGTCTSCARRKEEIVTQSLDEFSLNAENDQKILGQDIDQGKPPVSIAGLNNPFVKQIFQQALKETGWKNVNISPMGVSLAMAMAYEGAKAQTALEIRSVLGFPSEKEDAKAQAHREFSSFIPSLNDDQVSCINSSWFANNLEVLPEYKEILKMIYRAEAYNVDFCNSSRTTGQINAWCAEKTKNRIQEMIKQTTCDLRLVLMNAIYFKAKWEIPFSKAQTSKKNFSVDENVKVDVAMMMQKDKYAYAETGHFQVLEMPYEKKRFSMIVFLPRDQKSKTTLARLATDAEGQNLWQEMAQGLNALQKTDVIVQFPRFEFYSTWNRIKEYLQALGMKKAFEGNADFSGISTEPLLIDKIIQKTFIKVDEESTEAAAVTMVAMQSTALEVKEPPKEFIVDHPFIYMIKDSQTQSFLFIGQVVDPTKN